MGTGEHRSNGGHSDNICIKSLQGVVIKMRDIE